MRFPLIRRVALWTFGVRTPSTGGWVKIKRGLRYRTSSQALQDVFVQMMASFHDSRFYLEIGGADPEKHSNTFQLEKLGWNGLSVEISPEQVKKFRAARRNPILGTDALKLNYKSELENLNFPTELGFLQVDIEPPENSLSALKLIPFEIYKFAVIAFEHDAYYSGSAVRDESRAILRNHGYHRIVSDVEVAPGKSFEDWYIHPDLVGGSLATITTNRIWSRKLAKLVSIQAGD